LKFVNGDYFLNNEIKKDQINQTLAGFPSTVVGYIYDVID